MRHNGATAEDDHDMNASENAAAPTTQRPPPARANRLAGETSPYLLQHAHNPVDWYPWGREALDRAKRENKPIFLSIGYSACHWCHVMERESFEDAATAEILNQHFIAIKVDREERPDVDEIYMTAVQLMTGRGGWPLSVFLTPELKPFFGGTYFPPEDRYGMPGFKTVLTRLAEVWREQPDDVAENARRLVTAIEANVAGEATTADVPDASALVEAVSSLQRQFDAQWGGFGGAPKFPSNGAIALLLRQHARQPDEKLLEMATVTLDRMAYGGIYDHLGGGFHRYAVDERWLVPHFEKMLYDNALLSRVYLEAWQATGRDLYRQVAGGVFDYVLRDMTDARGGFHSAEDADSEGEEGKFYVWRPEEIEDVLGVEEAALFGDYYGVSAEGNFEGSNILNVARNPAAFLRDRDLTPQQLEGRLSQSRHKLLAHRDRRIRPAKDDKVLAAWNGMMISALARGYQVLGEQRYLEAAERAADFVLDEMVRDGTLLRTYRGEARLPGYLDDYAEMTLSLIDLYESGFQRQRLEAADRLARKMIDDFWDTDDGGFFYTSADHEDLLVRTKPLYDGAVPSGNASAAWALLRLARLLDRPEYAEKAEATLRYAAGEMRSQPRAYLNLFCALDLYLHGGPEIALAGTPDSDDTRRLLATIHGRFLPNKTLALIDPDAEGAAELGRLIPLLSAKRTTEGRTTVFVCEDFTCRRPVHEPDELEEILGGRKPSP